MTLTAAQRERLQQLTRDAARFDEPMQRHITMQVGGVADAWVQPQGLDELQAVLHFARESDVACMIVGRGSNLLVRDGGIRGVVIHLGHFDRLAIEPSNEVPADPDYVVLVAEAGVKLKRLLGLCAEEGFSGLEGLEGVPGTVGGAVVMNAGTPAGVIGDAVIDVCYLDRQAQQITRTAAQLAFAYRSTKIPKTAIVIHTRLRVTRVEPVAVRERLQQLRQQRMACQPGRQPCVGSVFRNPPKGSAWMLVDEAGLRGVRIGGARISEQHANWIVNEGNATARDVETLIRLVREKVKEKCGVLLDPEVMIVGEEP
ncbi:MAG: UDP-N-acetylmuramate dehydrogenase [Deltaproteobacteria bacterium]|nr:UDP-N-acetylmuramate dehydrogenase [Deltaproteobacteria bacterium]